MNCVLLIGTLEQQCMCFRFCLSNNLKRGLTRIEHLGILVNMAVYHMTVMTLFYDMTLQNYFLLVMLFF